jgi:hypothetical protein
MAWYLSENFVVFIIPGFDASFSLDASHDKSIFVFTAKMACIMFTQNRDFSSNQM